MTEEELQGWKGQGCILEVDLEYPEELHDLHNEYPLATERLEINTVEKLIPNNEFHYQLNGSTSDCSTLRFAPGAYEIKDINVVIQEVVSDKRIEFVAHAATGHIKLKLKPGVKVYFNHEKSFNTLLGF